MSVEKLREDIIVGSANDIITAKELGYLRRSSEENTKSIENFYKLLADHMKEEEREKKSLNNKLTLLFIITVAGLTKGTGLSVGLEGIVKSVFPLLF